MWMKKNVPESGTSRFTFSLINHSQLSWFDNNIDNRNKDVYLSIIRNHKKRILIRIISPL